MGKSLEPMAYEKLRSMAKGELPTLPGDLDALADEVMVIELELMKTNYYAKDYEQLPEIGRMPGMFISSKLLIEMSREIGSLATDLGQTWHKSAVRKLRKISDILHPRVRIQ